MQWLLCDGRKLFFQPYNLPADAKYIRFGDNVVVASGVTFICHDVIDHMFNHMPESTQDYRTCWGNIDIKDNVFIGANSTLLANVSVGPNAIIAAGSVINKNVPEGKIVGGVPARVIGDVADLMDKRKAYSATEFSQMNREDRLKRLWKEK